MTDRAPIVPTGYEATYDRYQFAPAFRVGQTLYVSGVIGRDAEGNVPVDPAAEYEAVFAGVANVLAAAGSSMSDIVEMTSFHTDLPETMGAFMKAKGAALGEPYPAWTAIGCTALAAPGARVEVKVTAVMPTEPS